MHLVKNTRFRLTYGCNSFVEARIFFSLFKSLFRSWYRAGFGHDTTLIFKTVFFCVQPYQNWGNWGNMAAWQQYNNYYQQQYPPPQVMQSSFRLIQSPSWWTYKQLVRKSLLDQPWMLLLNYPIRVKNSHTYVRYLINYINTFMDNGHQECFVT